MDLTLGEKSWTTKIYGSNRTTMGNKSILKIFNKNLQKLLKFLKNPKTSLKSRAWEIWSLGSQYFGNWKIECQRKITCKRRKWPWNLLRNFLELGQMLWCKCWLKVKTKNFQSLLWKKPCDFLRRVGWLKNGM